MGCLFGRDIQPLTENGPVTAGLVQQIDKVAVFQDVLDLRGTQKVLHILGNTCGNAAPFPKSLPDLHAPRRYLPMEQQVKFVYIVPGGFALAAVHRHPVPHLILDDQHPQVFQLLAQGFDIKAHQPIVDIHIGPMVKHIQTAVDIQLQSGTDPLGLRLRLRPDLVPQIFQNGHILRSGVCQITPVHLPQRAVNDGFLHRGQPKLVSRRDLAKGQNKVGFQRQGVVVLGVVQVDIQRIQVVAPAPAAAGGGKPDDLPAQPLHQREILRFRVTDQNIVLCYQEHVQNLPLGGEGLAAAGGA